jgi:hypothetical protein
LNNPFKYVIVIDLTYTMSNSDNNSIRNPSRFRFNPFPGMSPFSMSDENMPMTTDYCSLYSNTNRPHTPTPINYPRPVDIDASLPNDLHTINFGIHGLPNTMSACVFKSSPLDTTLNDHEVAHLVYELFMRLCDWSNCITLSQNFWQQYEYMFMCSKIDKKYHDCVIPAEDIQTCSVQSQMLPKLKWVQIKDIYYSIEY